MVGARVSPELVGAGVGIWVGVGVAQFLMKTRLSQQVAEYLERDAIKKLPQHLLLFAKLREPQAEPSAKTRAEVPHLLENAALRESAVLVASSQPLGTDIAVYVQPKSVPLRGQSSMVAYRQPVLLDVYVFDKDAAVGEMVGGYV